MKSHQRAAPVVSQGAEAQRELEASHGLSPELCVGSALGALRRGDLGSFFTWGAEDSSVANLLMTGLCSNSCKVGDRTFDATGGLATLQGLLTTGIDALAANKKDCMVRFCANLSHANQLRLFQWLKVPLQTETGAPARINQGNGAPEDAASLLGQAELPLVLQGLLQLPTRFWQDPATLQTYQGIRPGAASAYTGGALTAVSLDARVAKAREKAPEPLSDDDALREGQQDFADGVSHEIGHTIDNAMAGAHATLMASLGFAKLSGGAALATALELTGDAAKEGAAVVDAWLKTAGPPKTAETLKASMTEAAWSKIETTPLVDVLVKSGDPTRIDKADVGGSGYALYQPAGEIQVWGPTIRGHLASWGNDKAALSDREYCAELFRCYFEAGADQAAVLASYPKAAQDWIAAASAFDRNRG